jgi:outer membrane protein insertion porin family
LIGIVLTASPAMPQETSLDLMKYNSWLAKKPYISKINIEGNTFFSDSKIRSHLFSRKNSFWQSLKSGSRNRVLRYSANRDTMEVKYLYLLEGFLGVSVDERFDISPKDSSAIITLTIDEGNRFLVGSVELEISEGLPFYNDLRHTANRMKPGEAVNPIKLKEIVFDLKTIYANNGYPYAVVEESIDGSLGPSSTTIKIKAVEGDLVRFGDLQVGNLNYYSSDLARREVAFKKGELYSREKIIESQKRLYSTGYFNSINLDISREENGYTDSSGEQYTTPDFVFSAIERKPHFVTIKTGASQDSLQDLTWDLSTSLGKRNFLKSRRLELAVKYRFIIFTQWRTLYHRYLLRVTEPWLLGLRMPLAVTALFEPGVRSQLQPYRIQTWSISLSTRKEWSEQLFAVFTGRYEEVDIFGIVQEDEYKFRFEQGISIRRKIDMTLIRDTRLDKFLPRSGSFTTFYAQYVGGFLGGDDSFVKLEFSWAKYRWVIGRAVYASRIKTGWVKEFGRSHQVPINDRFYLGGANTIRGFREKSVGPRDQFGNIIGANAYGIFNQELRFPFFWKFWGSIFADLGNGWESFSQVTFDNILFAYGAGIQFISPAGPIRLDYAHRLENGPYKEGDRFHFTILYAF